MKANDGAGLTYAVGDIHGRLDLLEQLVARCLTDAKDRGCTAPLFVFLGDYVDRGSDSAGVLAFLRKFSAENRVVALVGNHDAMLVETVLGDDDGLDWAANGMASTAISYGYGALVGQSMCTDKRRASIVEALRSDRQAVEDALWLAGLPLVHQDEHRIFVHAGLRPSVALTDQRLFDLLWIREPFLRSRRSFGKLVVHGHTPTRDDQPEVRSKRVGLDTGAYSSGVLTTAIFSPVKPLPIAILRAS